MVFRNNWKQNKDGKEMKVTSHSWKFRFLPHYYKQLIRISISLVYQTVPNLINFVDFVTKSAT